MAELALPCCANGCFMPWRRTGKAVSPPLIQAKEELFHLFTTRLGKSSAFADPRESAFSQDAQRANVVFRGTSVQRTYLAVLWKGRERTGRNAFAPVELSKPVA